MTGWKSKWVYNSKFIPLDRAFLSNIKYYGSKMGIKFHKTHVVAHCVYGKIVRLCKIPQCSVGRLFSAEHYRNI